MSGIVFGEYKETRTAIERGNSVVIGVFFDGTGNNRKNVRAYKAYKGEAITMDAGEDVETYKKAYKKHKNDSNGDNSYNSDESNVSRLEPHYATDDSKVFKLYIEGIGTENFESDAGIGSAFGKGSTGVPARVEEACKRIVNEILPSVDSDLTDENNFKLIDQVYFDVYGFSRGAVAARHFVSQVKKRASHFEFVSREEGELQVIDTPAYGYLGKALKKKKTAISVVKIGFAGLYDSVSAYGIDHSDDNKDLELNQMYHANKTIHLVAQDEIRKNFNLTGIESAGAKGLTIGLPGVHSDIGGGYKEIIPKENTLLWDLSNDEKEAKKIRCDFIAEGWYKGYEIDIEDGWTRDEVWGRRKKLTNSYSVIALQLMADFSTKHKAKINLTTLKEKFKVTGSLLTEVQNRLDAALANKNTKGNLAIDLLKFSSKQNEKELLEQKDEEVVALIKKIKAKDVKETVQKNSLIVNYKIPEIAKDNTRVALPKRYINASKLRIKEKVDYTKLSDTQLIRALRNKYLHISFTYENLKASSWWHYTPVIYEILNLQEPMAPRKSGNRKVNNDTE